MDVIDAIKSRSSVRAYTDKPVSHNTVEEILDIARWAPSGANMQPWRVIVVTDKVKERVGTACSTAFKNGVEANPDYQYYPSTWQEPYKSRRQKTGLALYNALGIERKDKEKRVEAWLANYNFFGAPVGLLFFVEKNLAEGSLVDYGMFIQSVSLAAIGLGLSTCPQAALADYPDIVRDNVGVDEKWTLLCGMALGYKDESDPVNQYRTSREEVSSFAEWR
jgi:nitroreductase